MPERDQPSTVDTQLADIYERLRRIERQFSGLPKAAVTLNLRTVRVETGSVPASTTASVSVSWSPAFPDLNYSHEVTPEEPGLIGIVVLRVLSRSTTGIVVRVQNNDPAAAHGASLNVIAIHDT